MTEDPYDLHTQFPDIRDYVEWLGRNCEKCIHQKSGMGYSCKLLAELDKAVASMKWEISPSTAETIGLRTLENYDDDSDKCNKFWSKRKKERPPDAENEFS